MTYLVWEGSFLCIWDLHSECRRSWGAPAGSRLGRRNKTNRCRARGIHLLSAIDFARFDVVDAQWCRCDLKYASVLADFANIKNGREASHFQMADYRRATRVDLRLSRGLRPSGSLSRNQMTADISTAFDYAMPATNASQKPSPMAAEMRRTLTAKCQRRKACDASWNHPSVRATGRRELVVQPKLKTSGCLRAAAR